MAPCMKLVDNIADAIDRVFDGIKEWMLKKIEPQVLEEISKRVEEYKEKTLKELPEECEKTLIEEKSRNAAAWAIYKALGDDTSELVNSIVLEMKPGIDSAVDLLSLKATEIIMDRLRDAIDADGDSSSDEESDAGKDRPKHKTRGVDDLAPLSGEKDKKAKQVTKKTKKTQNKVNRTRGLKDHLPKIEKKAREFVHPLFEALQKAIEALVCPTVKMILTKKFDEIGGENDSSKSSDSEDDGNSIFSKGKEGIKKWYKKAEGDVKSASIDALIAAVDDPMYKLIDEEIAELEENSMSSAFASIRSTLEQYHVISKDPPIQNNTAKRDGKKDIAVRKDKDATDNDS